MDINKISLLPPSVRKRQEKRSDMIRLLCIIAITAGSLLFAGSVALIYRLTVESEVAIVKEQKETIKAIFEENKIYVETKEKVLKLESLIEKAMGTVPDWDKVIDAIAIIMPNEIYLENIEAHYGEEQTIIFQGQSSTVQAVKQFIEEMDEIRMLNKVELVYANQFLKEDKKVTAFEIKANIESNSPYQLSTQGGD